MQIIDNKTYTIQWIENVSKQNRNVDKILVEKVIRALTLLVELRKTELNFIFKGGTALMLMLQKPTRLSIDIDIIVPQKITEIEYFLDTITQSGVFTKYSLQARYTESDIQKAHYKFYYTPLIKTHSEEEYILLDILFENNPYSQLTETDIVCPFIAINQTLTVKTPTIENILGDKLTAFAPNTTGIPYYKGKASMSMEIVKQLYDIGNLFDEARDVETIRNTFVANATIELKYRNKQHLQPTDVLDDMMQTAFCLSSRGQAGECNFEDLQKGISRIKSYIFSTKYQIEDVIVSASKVAYLAALLKTGSNTIERYISENQCINYSITSIPYNKLNKLKRNITVAFFYWYKALEMLGFAD